MTLTSDRSRRYVDVQNLTVETFPTLAAVLRMASKYKIERPCHEIVARIRKQWPASLADHDTLVAQVRAPVQQLLAADDKGKAREGGAANVNAPPQTAFSNSVYLPQRSYHMNQMGSAANASAGPAMQNPFAMHGNAMHQIPVDPVPHFQPGGHLLAAHLDPFARNLNGSTVAQRVHDQFAQERAGAAIAAFLNRRQNAGPSNANPAAPAAGPAPGPAAPAVAAPVEDLIIHPASVIAVLRECGYSDSELFFPLFYALSRTTAQFGGAGLGYHLAPLSAADMERFVVGIERLRARHTALVVSTPSFDPVQGFGGSFHFCREGAQELWANLVHTLLVTNEQRPHEPIEEWQDMVASVNAQHGRHQVCADCCKVIVAKIQAYRAALWESLPRFFELA